MAWEKIQARLFVKHARARAGDGWSLLGPAIQEALIARELVGVLTAQAARSVETEAVENLWRDMLAIAGLR